MQSAQLVPSTPRPSLVAVISLHKRLKRSPPIIRINSRQYLLQLPTMFQNMMRTLRFQFHLQLKRLQLQSLKHLLVKLQQHRLLFLKDLTSIQNFSHSYKNVWRCSTMELSIGLWVNSLPSVHYSRQDIQSALPVKIHAVEHLAIATLLLSIKRMDKSGRHYVH